MAAVEPSAALGCFEDQPIVNVGQFVQYGIA